MPEIKEQKQMKMCKGCKEVKQLDTEYYRAGKFYQSLCKICHNIKRYEYPLSKSNYQKRAIGFDKLMPTKQQEIMYDVYVKLSYRKIAAKTGIKYSTLLHWKNHGKIPAYKPPQ
jgi:hypothetical protein